MFRCKSEIQINNSKIYLVPTLQKRKLNVSFKNRPINAIRRNKRSYSENRTKHIDVAWSECKSFSMLEQMVRRAIPDILL